MNIYPQQTYDVDAGRSIFAMGQTAPVDKWCEEIKAACAGIGTNEEKLVAVFSTKTATERALIHHRYPQLYNTTLLSEIKSETSSDFGKLLQILCQPIEEAEAMIIRSSIKGAGTNERLLIPVLSGRTNTELNILKKAFFKNYQKDLVVELADDLGGDLKTFYLAVVNQMAQAYNPTIHTPAKAAEIAEMIYQAGEGKWGTDEAGFCNALCSIPPEFMATVNSTYMAKHKNSITYAIEKEFGGKAEEGLVYHVGMILHPVETIAMQFERTMKGIGTDEYGLSATLIRYQHLLPQVKQAYLAKYGTPLRDRINGETGGNYRTLLLAILDSAR